MSVKGVHALLEKAFLRNEKVSSMSQSSPGNAPLTDKQLVKLAASKYPDANVGLDEVAKFRRDFNSGSGQWSSLGSAQKRGFPKSRAFDDNGKPITRPIENSDDSMRPADQSRQSGNVAEIARAEARKEIVEWGQKIQTDVNKFLGELDVDIKTEVGNQLAEAIKDRPVIKIIVPDHSEITIEGKTHEKFEEVMVKIAAGMNILLVGPTGSGKTFLARQIAEALDVPFSMNSMSEGVSESALLGRTLPDKDGNWVYRPAPFVTAYTEGGVHLLDELDAADPNLLVQINAALANGYLSVPYAEQTEPFDKSDRFYVICAANTFGRGADREYVGRNQLDTATLNRYTFGRVFIDYDRDLGKSYRSRAAQRLRRGKPA